ncbi:MAG: hypothetical protein RBR35_17725 [Salinivirgaceae bacterium]|nr:hypothetical protein [Salinivirgaceae bacterium]
MENKTFTQTEILANPTTLSWVYILYNIKTKEMNIGLSFTLVNRLSNVDWIEKLVYYRSFGNPFDALAHKFLLESLSVESMMHNIKQVNPTLNSLTVEINKT